MKGFLLICVIECIIFETIDKHNWVFLMNDYRKLKNQPLKLVLAEFRFSPIMQIAEYIPKLQEALRKQFPIFDRQTEQEIHFQPGGILASALDRWSFIAAKKKSAIVINKERLIFYTSEYNRFEGFSAACKDALNILVRIVEPSLILRVGLRYSDLVKVDKNEQISDLIDPHFVFPNSVADLGESQHQHSEVFLKTQLGGLFIRTLYGYHNLSHLPDIQDLPVIINEDASSNERIILDFDHFWQPPADEAVSFEVDEILSKLDGLHETSRKAFWKITTDHARNEKWA